MGSGQGIFGEDRGQEQGSFFSGFDQPVIAFLPDHTQRKSGKPAPEPDPSNKEQRCIPRLRAETPEMQAVDDQRKKGVLSRPGADKVHDPVPLYEQSEISGERGKVSSVSSKPALLASLKIMTGYDDERMTTP